MIDQQGVSWADVFDALDRGVTVVTGNTRLAGRFGRRLNKERSARRPAGLPALDPDDGQLTLLRDLLQSLPF